MNEQDYLDKVLRLTTRLELFSKTASASISRVLTKRLNELVAAFATGDWLTKKDVRLMVTEINGILDGINIAQQAVRDKAFYAAIDAGVVAEKAAMVTIIGGATLDIDAVRIYNKAMARVIQDGAFTVGSFWDKYVRTSDKRYKTLPVLAYQEGWSMTRATQALQQYTKTDRKSAQAVIRTSVMSAANVAREDVARQYGVEMQIFKATLDSRTTPICQYNDGKVFKLKEGPMPPLHVSCRSVRLSVPNDMTPAAFKKELETSYRDDEGKTQIGKYKNYGTWLKSQSKEFQQEVLGKKRAALFRSGKVTFNRMFTRSGKYVRLADLKL